MAKKVTPDKQSQTSAATTVACVAVGLSGIAINVTCPDYGLGENAFGLVVLCSMGMIAVGFLPRALRWKYWKGAGIVMGLSTVAYILYASWHIITNPST